MVLDNTSNEQIDPMSALKPHEIIHSFLQSKHYRSDSQAVGRAMKLLIQTYGKESAVTTQSCIESDPDNVIDNTVFHINESRKEISHVVEDTEEFNRLFDFFMQNIADKCSLSFNKDDKKKLESLPFHDGFKEYGFLAYRFHGAATVR